MLAVTHNNASLENFHVRRIGYDISNLAIASVGLAVLDRLEKLSHEHEDELFHLTCFDDDLENDDSMVTDHAVFKRRPLLNMDTVLETEIENGDGEEPFFVGDIGIVVKQFDYWKSLLPRVEPFYAIKCNTDRAILTALNNLGTGFDCASKAEIQTMLDMGVDPSRIIYANPCKPASHIRYAREKGVRMMTFDNLTELVKIKQDYPEAELVLRIVTDDSKSVCRFSVKFGAALSSVEHLLQAAKSMELNVIGVSFHVGSGCNDAAQYNDALKSARFVFDTACQLGYDMSKFHFLDIGGGFPGTEDGIVSFAQIAHVVNDSLDEFFPAAAFPQLRVIAEPGRFFASAAFSLAVCITSCRVMAEKNAASDAVSKKFMYYVNDGVYGSFNCVLFDHAIVKPEVLTQHGRFLSRQPWALRDHDTHACSLWGPTCDSMDCIMKELTLPELDVGDWLSFRNMGAYTMAAASTFNGFPRSKVVYINQEAWRDRAAFAATDAGFGAQSM